MLFLVTLAASAAGVYYVQNNKHKFGEDKHLTRKDFSDKK